MSNKLSNTHPVIKTIVIVLLMLVLVIMYGITKLENITYQNQLNQYTEYQKTRYKVFVANLTDFNNKYLSANELTTESLQNAYLQTNIITSDLMSTVVYIKAKYDNRQPWELQELYSDISDFTQSAQKSIEKGQVTEECKSSADKLRKRIQYFVKKYPNLLEQLENGDKSIFI